MARVLIVDDEAAIRTIVGAYAESDGHTVAVACDASEALDLLEREAFDIVVSDIVLPRRSGVALLADIRTARPDVQVIMMTGEPELGTAVEAVRQGAFDYLAKPISREAISKALTAAAAKKALIDRNRALEEENQRHREHLEQLVNERTEQLTRINQMALELGKISDVNHIYETVHQHVRDLMDAKTFIVSFFDEEQQLIRAGYAVFRDKPFDVSQLPPIPLERAGSGTQSQVIHTGEPLYVPDYRKAREKGSTEYNVEDGKAVRKGPPPEDAEEITRSALFVPLKIESKVIGVMQVQSYRLDGYTEVDMDLLAGLANVAAVAISNSRLVQESRAALDGTIRVVSDAMEIRDPYTAGHQRRLAELAHAIGRELGLPKKTVYGLRVAGLLHDVGKLGIPAEILAKPAPLSDNEYLLVKNHALIGFDLLQTVKFPWPVALIVYQHHERMDGSGYPQGLAGEIILIEARIIAVADVIEAMSTHRPYRGSLGIHAALEEIRLGRGTRYDPGVVDACITLFETNRFRFSG